MIKKGVLMAEQKVNKSSVTLRIDTNLLDTIDTICTQETNKLKYDVDRSDILRRALIEFIERYDKAS